jgi:hypothetical protein
MYDIVRKTIIMLSNNNSLPRGHANISGNIIVVGTNLQVIQTPRLRRRPDFKFASDDLPKQKGKHQLPSPLLQKTEVL